MKFIYKVLTLLLARILLIQVIVASRNIYKDEFLINYLHTFGYLKETDGNSSLTTLKEDEVKDGVRLFKEYWNIRDAATDEEIMEAMKRPRCGITDDVWEYKSTPQMWSKDTLKWYFHLALSDMLGTINKGFQEWSKVTNITFVRTYDKHDADILIRNSPNFHTFLRNENETCEYKLGGTVLGHAYFPTADQTPKEIHLSKHLRWYNGLGDIPENHYSLYWILMHEVGHALGLTHSSSGNIMLPV